jgi:hypothetical protein
VETIEADRYPLSPRIRMLWLILAKFGLAAPAPGGKTSPAACISSMHSRSTSLRSASE